MRAEELSVFLAYDIYNFLWNEDELLDRLAVDPLLSVGMSQDGCLDLIGSSVGREVDGEAHFAADLDWILDGRLDEEALVELRPLGIAHGGGVAQLVPELLGDVRGERCDEDDELLEDVAAGALLLGELVDGYHEGRDGGVV